MPMPTLERVEAPLPPDEDRYRRVLEEGRILFFPRTPFPLPEEDRALLLRQRQSGAGVWRSGGTYDRFMLSFHHFLKESRGFQDEGGKTTLEFPAGSTWMVFTDMVSHAVLGGRYALEQTFIVSRASLALPEKAPIAILERIAGAPLG